MDILDSSLHDERFPAEIDVYKVPHSRMKQHVRVVHCEKKFQCNICNKSFKINANLRKHKTIVHEKDKPYECDTCGLQVAQKGHLKHHDKTVHKKIKDYLCEICDKRFTQSLHLKRHNFIMHCSTEDSLKCEFCENTLGDKTALTNHQRNIHTLNEKK